MSTSTFHHHFRTVTSSSPMQFQKQLPLIEARRRMLAEEGPASQVAFSVGYESVPQFTREYARIFGPRGRGGTGTLAQDAGGRASRSRWWRPAIPPCAAAMPPASP